MVGAGEGWGRVRGGLILVISAVRNKLVCFAPENQMAYLTETTQMQVMVPFSLQHAEVLTEHSGAS